MTHLRARVALYANTEWYLYNFRLPLLRALRDQGHSLLLLSPDGPYGEKLKAEGFDWRPVPMSRRSLNPLRELKLVLYLRQVLRSERIELVHGFTIKSAVYGSLAARLASVPHRINAVAGMGYVFTSQDMKARMLRRPVAALCRLAFLGEQCRLIVQNPDDGDFFRQQGLIDASHIRLIKGSGVDTSRFKPCCALTETQAPNEASGQIYVLLAARVLWDKGLQEFVDAARMVKSKHPQVEFVLAGEPDSGNPASVPEHKILFWQDSGLLTWLGHVSDMPTLLSKMDIMVLPSYREGLPKGLIEAGASGIALITSDVPGCREVVTDGQSGLLVPPREAPALASAINRLVEEPQFRRKLGDAARAVALAEFDQDIINQQTLAVYQELLRE